MIVCVCVHAHVCEGGVGVCTCMHISVKVKEQPVELDSLLLPHRSQRSTASICQA